MFRNLVLVSAILMSTVPSEGCNGRHGHHLGKGHHHLKHKKLLDKLLDEPEEELGPVVAVEEQVRHEHFHYNEKSPEQSSYYPLGAPLDITVPETPPPLSTIYRKVKPVKKKYKNFIPIKMPKHLSKYHPKKLLKHQLKKLHKLRHHLKHFFGPEELDEEEVYQEIIEEPIKTIKHHHHHYNHPNYQKVSEINVGQVQQPQAPINAAPQVTSSVIPLTNSNTRVSLNDYTPLQPLQQQPLQITTKILSPHQQKVYDYLDSGDYGSKVIKYQKYGIITQPELSNVPLITPQRFGKPIYQSSPLSYQHSHFKVNPGVTTYPNKVKYPHSVSYFPASSTHQHGKFHQVYGNLDVPSILSQRPSSLVSSSNPTVSSAYG